MNVAQATTEAKRRWGSGAFAEAAANGFLDIKRATAQPGINTLLGWGHTWEEALEMAESRMSACPHCSEIRICGAPYRLRRRTVVKSRYIDAGEEMLYIRPIPMLIVER